MKQYLSSGLGLFALAVAATLVVSGCTSHKSDRRRAVPGKAPGYPPDSHLVFGPGAGMVPFVDVPRADWPAAAARGARGETIQYTERLLDRQGQYGHDQDYLVRRFRSVRTGRIGR